MVQRGGSLIYMYMIDGQIKCFIQTSSFKDNVVLILLGILQRFFFNCWVSLMINVIVFPAFVINFLISF